MGLTIMRYLVFLLVALSFQAQSATFWNRFTTNADNVSVNGSTLTNLLVFTNTQTVWVNSNGVTGVRGVMEKPFRDFATAVSNSLDGDTIFLLGNTAITNSGQAFQALHLTNRNIIGNGATLTLNNTVLAGVTDQILLSGDVSIRDLTFTNKNYLDYTYPLSLMVTLSNLFLEGVNVFSHGSCLYSDAGGVENGVKRNIDIKAGTLLTDAKTNATSFGGGDMAGAVNGTRFVSIGTNYNYGFASAAYNALVFNSPMFTTTNGRIQNICFSTTDGDKIIVNGGLFECHAPTEDLSAVGNCAIEFLGFATTLSSLTLNNCYFDLAKNGVKTFLCRMANLDDGTTIFGSLTLNNCNYRPLTNGVIFDNTGGGAGSFPVIVSGGNLVPSNFADPTKVIWSTLTSIGASNGVAAGPGLVGEVSSSLIAVGSATSLTTATAKNVTSISLTAGDWDVSGNISFIATAATTTATVGGIGTTSATLPTDGTEVNSGVIGTLISETDGVTLNPKQINVLVTTTVYLVAKATFSAGTTTAYGSIRARRVR